MAAPITMGPEGLQVPENPIIPFIEGDGIGPDIWAAAKNVFDSAVAKAYGGERQVEWTEVLAGQKAFDQTGQWLPDETIDMFRTHLVGIKGPLTTPVGGGIRSLNVALRQILDLYVCLRPVTWYAGVPSPVKHPELVDMVIFRENTEDVYAGKEVEAGSEGAKALLAFLDEEFGWDIRPDSGLGIKPISETGSKRLVRAAIEYALANNRKSLTLVHKGNIMKFTEGSFAKWGYEVASEEFGDQTISEKRLWDEFDGKMPEGKVLVKDRIADSIFQQIQTRPEEYSVLALPNLNGDYMSDAAIALVGGLGLGPGANMSDEVGLFEATHGTAPKYTGMDKVNPGSLILSAVMMLEYMEWGEAANLINTGLAAAVVQGQVTYDLARLMVREGRKDVNELSCSGFGDAIIERM